MCFRSRAHLRSLVTGDKWLTIAHDYHAGAWIVTGGNNAGVMKLVGSAVRFNFSRLVSSHLIRCPRFRSVSKFSTVAFHCSLQVRDYAAFGSEPVACIGVAPWGCVADRRVLVNHPEQVPVQTQPALPTHELY